MSSDLETLAARLRQLLAADRNALDLYRQLSQSEVPEVKEVASTIATEEARHVVLDGRMLDLVETTLKEGG